jgi:hypothetical protein
MSFRTWTDRPVCARGHDLSARTSFHRAKNGARWCVQFEITWYPTGDLARKDRQHNARYRQQAQARAVETSVRITKGMVGA